MLHPVATAIFLITLLAAPAAAQELPSGTVIAVIDWRYVEYNAEASKGIRSQLDAIASGFSVEISELENEVRSMQQELARQEAILAPEVFAQRGREFEDRVEFVQRLLNQRNNQIDQAFNFAITQVRDALSQVLDDASAQIGLTLVLDRTDIHYVHPSMDITEWALAALNEKLPSVNVSPPAN
jgi:outer membrane protein